MAGERAPIAYESSLPAILQFMQNAMGSKETKESSANIDPLMQIFGQQNDPAALANLVAQLFQSGAAQVPQLTTQFANATGTRTTNNSMLGNSLALLNQNIAQAIAQSVVQQQANASATAGRVADATRNETRVTKPAKNPYGVLGLATLGGSILNKVGKNTGFGADEEVIPGGASPSSVGVEAPTPFPDVFSSPAPFVGSPIETSLDPIFTSGIGFDGGVGLGGGVGEGLDMGNGFGESIADPTSFQDIGSVVDLPLDDIPLDDFGGFEEFFSDFGGFFADGGRVPSYADGGAVRNRANFGAYPEIPLTKAITLNKQLVNNRIANPLPSAPKKRSGGVSDIDVPGTNSPGATTGGAPEGIAGGPPGGFGGLSIGQAVAIGIATITGGPLAGVTALGKSLGINALTQGLAGLNNTVDLEAIDTFDMEQGALMGQGLGFGNVGEIDMSSPAVDMSGMDTSEPDADPGTSDFGGSEAGDADAGDGDASGGDDGDSGGDDGGDGGDGGMADGGIISHKSAKKKPRVLDSETIKATPGEYVLPVDVVEFIGKSTLDDLVKMVHTPVRTGTHG